MYLTRYLSKQRRRFCDVVCDVDCESLYLNGMHMCQTSPKSRRTVFKSFCYDLVKIFNFVPFFQTFLHIFALQIFSSNLSSDGILNCMLYLTLDENVYIHFIYTNEKTCSSTTKTMNSVSCIYFPFTMQNMCKIIVLSFNYVGFSYFSQ